MQKTIQQVNVDFKNTLKKLYSNAEIQQLLYLIYEQAIGLSRLQVITENSRIIETNKLEQIREIQNRLLRHEPIQYILGQTEFFDLNFSVNSSVLIPRPETEELIHWIISENKTEKLKVLDIGTGSGCIAVALAKNLNKARINAVDVSVNALKTAVKNANKNHVAINFINTDILSTKPELLPHNIDIIVSNPPYVKKSERKLMQANVLDFEPEIALFVKDNNPLIFYKKIASLGKDILSYKGKIYFEINEALAAGVCEMLKLLKYKNLEVRKDINGKNRMVKAEL